MADRNRKKEKKRLKREQKKREERRGGAVAELARAALGELQDCYVNENWREWGQAAVWVARRWQGKLVVAAFFIDTWCAGLKDAWTKALPSSDDLDAWLDEMEDQFDAEVVKIPLGEAREIVAGGIAFAHKNGFRLPAHLERATAFLGPGHLPVGIADLSAFGVEGGKLRWVGPEYDLARRLVSGTVEEFRRRPDVLEVVTDEQWEAGGRPMTREGFEELINNLADAVADWCGKTGRPEPEHLGDAAAAMMTAVVMTMPRSEEEAARPAERSRERLNAKAAALVEQLFPQEHRAAIVAALGVIGEFVQSQGLEEFLDAAEPGLGGGPG